MKQKVEIFFDYVCPFSYMATGIVKRLKEEFNIEEQWVPIQFNPETPKHGMPLTSLKDETSLAEMYSHLEDISKSYNLDIRRPSHLPNSYMAIAAGEYARENGKFDEFRDNTFYAYFVEGKDVGARSEVLDIIISLKLDVEEFLKKFSKGYYDKVLKTMEDNAKKQGINTTPTFIIDGAETIVGDNSIEKYREALYKHSYRE